MGQRLMTLDSDSCPPDSCPPLGPSGPDRRTDTAVTTTGTGSAALTSFHGPWWGRPRRMRIGYTSMTLRAATSTRLS
jgi:hypothetical protein